MSIGLVPAVPTGSLQKMADFADQGIFKDSSVITLIADYNAEAVPTQITYDQINEKIQVQDICAFTLANFSS